ncbi:ribulose-phosphate 3-epimerase [Pararhizobium polonicum]|uniref:Ribulose-phosphate 3-epimerase n=1 Tax=Pararhizobium polonicum TaxID=1612624 RepID=A0A1C7NXQ2_9HYPH|nr:GFA family protein [Pararhizobium polonicum]OBZ93791.1 ribulose-phosphate 3-epimerase [Pararhizobium polonicum]
METREYLGGCLCGSIRFRATGTPGNPHTCSCTSCQRHSGAPTLSWVEFPSHAVEWTGEGGMPALYRSSDYSSRSFCPTCGSTLGAVDDEPVIALVTGSFDARDDAALQPVSHSFDDSCPAWWKVPAAG